MTPQRYPRDSTVSRTTGFWPGIKHFSLYTSDPDPALTIFINTYTVHLSYIFSKHSPVCFSQVQDQIPIVMKFFGTERDYENKFLTDLTNRKQITFPIIDYNNTSIIILY